MDRPDDVSTAYLGNFSRETGNLIFHVALLVALVLIAVGRLYTYEGLVIVRQGNGFCSTSGNFQYRPITPATSACVRSSASRSNDSSRE